MLVDQAIYTSCQTSRSAGYQLVAASPGIADIDARELSLWGPSHDSLWESGAAAVSVNFHRLPSGAYCISQTTPAGAEYSQRRGPQVYTQSLVVDAQGLAEFGNNPFALLQASIALGHVNVPEKVPKRLEPFWLEPEPRGESKDALAQLVRHPGPVWLGLLLDRALHSSALGIVAGERGACLVSALIQCLPRDCRTAFSFTTGLRFSPRRPFRVICLPNTPLDNQRLVRQQLLSLLEIKNRPPENPSLGGWAGFVTAAISGGNFDFLAAELTRSRENLNLADLDALGDRLTQELKSAPAVPAPAAVQQAAAANEAPHAAAPLYAQAGAHPWQRADGAHARPGIVAAQVAELPASLSTDETLAIEEEPARTLAVACPSALENLQRLEDLIFEAIAGKDVQQELSRLWGTVLSQVGVVRAEAAREQFLRYALAVWRQLMKSDGLPDPERAIGAMQAICVLFDEPL